MHFGIKLYKIRECVNIVLNYQHTPTLLHNSLTIMVSKVMGRNSYAMKCMKHMVTGSNEAHVSFLHDIRLS
jgi:hypothetical protein